MAHAKDRITADSAEHWVLFTLKTFEEKVTADGVSAATLYKASGEKFPSIEYVEDALDELVYRRLVVTDETADTTVYQTCPPTGSVLSHHGTPDRAPWLSPVAFGGTTTLPEENDWVADDHDRVYYKTEGDRFERGEEQIARRVAEKFPEWTVLVTMGPYRGHDVQFQLAEDDPVILLDFYSVHIGSEYVSEVLWRLEAMVKKRELRENRPGESETDQPVTWQD